MMLSRASRIGTLLCLSIVATQIVPSISSGESENVTEEVRLAVRLIVFETFRESFMRLTLPSESDAAKGFEVCSKIMVWEFEKRFEDYGDYDKQYIVPLDDIKEKINSWTLDPVVSRRRIAFEEGVNIYKILSERPFKVILEHAFVPSPGIIVYGTTGFVELTGRNDTERTGAYLYAFREFQIAKPLNVTYKRENVDGGRCTLWGQFCPTHFRVDGLSDEESKNLFRYFRSEVLKQFRFISSDSGRTRELLGKYLPETLKDSLAWTEQNPDKLPNEIFEEDPFNTYTYY